MLFREWSRKRVLLQIYVILFKRVCIFADVKNRAILYNRYVVLRFRECIVLYKICSTTMQSSKQLCLDLNWIFPYILQSFSSIYFRLSHYKLLINVFSFLLQFVNLWLLYLSNLISYFLIWNFSNHHHCKLRRLTFLFIFIVV